MEGSTIVLYVVGVPGLLLFALLWYTVLRVILVGIMNMIIDLKDSLSRERETGRRLRNLLPSPPKKAPRPVSPPNPRAPSQGIATTSDKAEISTLRVVESDWWRVDDWRKLLDREDVLILDTEGQDGEVWEVAAIDTTGKLQIHALCRVSGHGSKRAHRVEDRARTWQSVQPELCSLLQQARVILAWNVPHDRRILHRTSLRYGLTMPDKLEWRDALIDYRAIRPGARHGLRDALLLEDSLHKQDIPLHWAQGDCQAVLGVMRAVVQNSEKGAPAAVDARLPAAMPRSRRCMKCGRLWEPGINYCEVCERWLR